MRRLPIITLALLAGLGGLGYVTYMVRAGSPPGQMTLTVSPASQSVVRGETASFSVGVVRGASSVGATSLRIAGLPRGVHPHWQLADGRYVRSVPSTATGAVLTLRTSARTPLGARTMRILATSHGVRRARRLTLTVLRRRSPNFSLKVTPARQMLPRGATAIFAVSLMRSARLRRGRLSLRVLGVPKGARARFTRTALRISTGAAQRRGSSRLVVEATSRIGSSAIRRYAVVVMTVVSGRPFLIGGDLATPLYPGGGAPLNLVLTNRHRFDIRVRALHVDVRTDTTRRSCRGSVNYAARQYRGRYPLLLHPGSTSLSALVSSRSLWPRVSMHNLSTNQDACKRAVVSLVYRGLATR